MTTRKPGSMGPAAMALGMLGALTLALSACGSAGFGGISTPDGRGSVVTSPPERVALLSADAFRAQLEAGATGRALLQLAGAPKCTMDLRSLEYRTVGAQGEPTQATAAVMVPSGTDAACTGPRPVLLYAHGTSTARSFDIARWTDPAQPAAGEGLLVAAMFAAQGYIVVAPNYAGYAQSTLPYHSYLNGDQQGKDMVDALTAARRTFASIAASDAGTLFVTGYSQGGYVALAAHRELQSLGRPVTASAPLSAPSAISLLTDYTFGGWPALGSTVFVPLLSTSWQRQSGTVYRATSDLYEPRYASGIDALLPSTTPIATLFADGKLPRLALFPAQAVPGPASPALAAYYGADNLIRQSFLTQAAGDLAAHPCPGNALPATEASLGSATPLDCRPTLGMRRSAVANDLRNWVPQRPVLMCGGAGDPTVNFLSTRATAGYFRASGMPAAALTVVDLESRGSDMYASARAGFAQAKAAAAANAAGTPADKARAVTAAYHATLLPPFCMAVARGFFQGVLNAGR